jgi:penicillin-binding protein 1B
VTTVRPPKPAAKPASRSRLAFLRGRSWKFYAALAAGIPLLLGGIVIGYFYVSFSRIIDARMHGEFLRTDPRIFARPLIIRRGQRLTLPQMMDRLNDLGYAQRPTVDQPGQFAIGRDALAVIPRAGERAGQTIRFVFAPTTPKGGGGGLLSIETLKKQRLEGIEMDAPLLTALINEGREKRRDVPLASIPPRMIQALLAIEDRRFYDHSGVDWIGTARAVFTNLFGSRKYLSGGSTITQQLVRNTFLTSMWGLDKARERGGLSGLKRKFTEQLMSVALERRLTKDKVLELYLNDVDLGQRGSFAIRGVPEAARLFFGKDVSNLTLVESAMIAGIVQAPSRYAPFNYPDRAKERRNIVLRAMATAGYISSEAADRAVLEPLHLVPRALESEAPYFVDYLQQELEKTPAVGAVDIYTTLDLHYQRLAQDAVREGLLRVDGMLSKRRPRFPQAALIAIDPRSGEILAMVGGRSYNQSQYNRAVTSKRQPGSTFKPFVYLAAFERAQQEGRTDITPATIVVDEPTTFTFNEQLWTPGNYDNEYDGPITLRRALAQSRNVATVKVAESTGFDNVAAVWRRFGIGTPPKGYPSIALGVFEASPFEMATAYTVFPNLGTIRPLRGLRRIVSEGKDLAIPPSPPKTVADKDATFLVLNMMRAVLNEGTAAGARSAGFTLDAAGKTGTTNDLRDAWFVGFTPELLTVVWVGLDDNQVLGLSGAQAALPIWTQFMSRALAGHANLPFEVPEGIVFVDIDRDTGKLASPACPKVVREAFLPGTEPVEICHVHYF